MCFFLLLFCVVLTPSSESDFKNFRVKDVKNPSSKGLNVMFLRALQQVVKTNSHPVVFFLVI